MKRLNINLILISLILIFSLVSCSNLFGEKEKPVTTEDGYVIKGTIYLGSKTGAAPSFTGKNGRAATYSFEQEAENSSFTVYADYLDYAEHDYPNGSKNNFVQAVFDYGRHAWTYSINLSVKGKYQIRAERRVLGTEVWTSEPVEINVISNTIQKVPDILMKPKLDNTANAVGRTELRFKDETSAQKIKMVVVHAPKTEDTSSYADYRTTIAEGLVMTGIDLPTGSYEVTIKFYDVITDIPENVKELYSTKETLNFLSGFTTDTWYDDSENYKVDDAGSYFAITDKLLNSYSNPGDLEHPTVLWSDTTQKQSSMYSIIENIYSQDYGLQIFGEVSEGETISNPIIRNAYSFCFSDNYVFIMTRTFVEETGNYEYTLQGYKASYSKYIPDTNMNFALEYPDISKGLAWYDNAIYFTYNDKNSPGTETGWHFARLDLSTKEIATTEALDNSTLAPSRYMISTGMAINSNYIYYIVYKCDSGGAPDSDYFIYRSPYSYNDDDGDGKKDLNVSLVSSNSNGEDNGGFKSWSLFMNAPQSQETYAKKLGYEAPLEEKDFRIGDLQIIHEPALDKDYIYALVYVTGPSSYYYDKTNDVKAKIGGGSGGIMWFESDLTPVRWNGWHLADSEESDNPYILGCYAKNPKELYINNNSDSNPIWGPGNEDSDYDLITIIQPPLEDEDKYFYGPRRFIAIKPDELVIADDGAHIDDDNIYCKSRVVKVNLNAKSLSTMNVNVTYSSVFSATSGAYVKD